METVENIYPRGFVIVGILENGQVEYYQHQNPRNPIILNFLFKMNKAFVANYIETERLLLPDAEE